MSEVDPDDTGRRSEGKRVTVVGIGASAGGLEALQRFFEAYEAAYRAAANDAVAEGQAAGTGIAFVVVAHLAPDQESLLPELLQRMTAMPVHEVNERLAVEPGHVYVIPPNRRLLMTDTHVDAESFHEPRGRPSPPGWSTSSCRRPSWRASYWPITRTACTCPTTRAS